VGFAIYLNSSKSRQFNFGDKNRRRVIDEW